MYLNFHAELMDKIINGNVLMDHYCELFNFS